MKKSVSQMIKEILSELDALQASDRVLRVAQMAIAQGHDMIEDVECGPQQFNAWYDIEARRDSISEARMSLYMELENLGYKAAA